MRRTLWCPARTLELETVTRAESAAPSGKDAGMPLFTGTHRTTVLRTRRTDSSSMPSFKQYFASRVYNVLVLALLSSMILYRSQGNWRAAVEC